MAFGTNSNQCPVKKCFISNSGRRFLLVGLFASLRFFYSPFIMLWFVCYFLYNTLYDSNDYYITLLVGWLVGLAVLVTLCHHWTLIADECCFFFCFAFFNSISLFLSPLSFIIWFFFVCLFFIFSGRYQTIYKSAFHRGIFFFLYNGKFVFINGTTALVIFSFDFKLPFWSVYVVVWCFYFWYDDIFALLEFFSFKLFALNQPVSNWRKMKFNNTIRFDFDRQ